MGNGVMDRSMRGVRAGGSLCVSRISVFTSPLSITSFDYFPDIYTFWYPNQDELRI